MIFIILDQIYYPAACHYFPPDVLEEHRLFIRDGKMYRADDGSLFDTRYAYISETSNLPSAIFVMDEHGNFYASGVYSTGAGRHHSSFLSGGPVAGAGEIAAEAGVPFYINRNSGHYHPGLELHQQVQEVLKEQGVDIDRIQFDDRRWLWY
jgi:hypothetical protein